MSRKLNEISSYVVNLSVCCYSKASMINVSPMAPNDKESGNISASELSTSKEVHRGKITLIQAVGFIVEYQTAPHNNTLTNISKTYNMDIDLINKTVEYFKIFQVNTMSDTSNAKLNTISEIRNSSKNPPE